MNAKKKQNVILTTTLVAILIFSIVLARHLAKNMESDVSQERSALTMEYKALKDVPQTYDPLLGSEIYGNLCMDCHGDKGQGGGTNPALTSPEIYQDQKALLTIVLIGKGNMPSHYKLPHNDMAHVLTYISQQFGQQSTVTTPLNIIDFKIDSLKNK